MGRMVVLRHETPDGAWHYDWMFEREGTSVAAGLITFRMGNRPDEPAGALFGERLADHRRVYLEYEGEVPGGRGRVSRVAAGRCEIVREEGEVFEVKAQFEGGEEVVWHGRSGKDGVWEFRVEAG